LASAFQAAGVLGGCIGAPYAVALRRRHLFVIRRLTIRHFERRLRTDTFGSRVVRDQTQRAQADLRKSFLHHSPTLSPNRRQLSTIARSDASANVQKRATQPQLSPERGPPVRRAVQMSARSEE